MRTSAVVMVCCVFAVLSACSSDRDETGPLDGVTDPPAASGSDPETGSGGQGGNVDEGSEGGGTGSPEDGAEPRVPEWSTDLDLEPEEFTAVEESLISLEKQLVVVNNFYHSGLLDEEAAAEVMSIGELNSLREDGAPVLNDGVRLEGEMDESDHHVSEVSLSDSEGPMVRVLVCVNTTETKFVKSDGSDLFTKQPERDSVIAYVLREEAGKWKTNSREKEELQCGG